MENYTQKRNTRSYFWLMLAIVATAAAAAAAHLSLPAAALEEDAAMGDAMSGLLSFLLRTTLLIPLLCVTPALWARSAWRVHPASLGLLAVLAFGVGYLCTGDAVSALCTMGILAPAGILLYVMQRLKETNFRIVLYHSIVLLFGLFVLIGVPTLVSDGDAFLPMRNLVGAYRTIWDATVADFDALGLSDVIAPQTETVGEMLTAFKLNADQYMIELLYYPAALAALANCLLSHLFNRKGGAKLSPLPPFAEWQIEPAYFYGALALSLAAYLLSFSGSAYGMALVRIGYAFWTLPMSLLGLCTLKRWTTGKPWLFAIFCVAAAMLYSFAGSLLTVIGMIGFMQERMRKRMQGGNGQ